MRMGTTIYAVATLAVKDSPCGSCNSNKSAGGLGRLINSF